MRDIWIPWELYGAGVGVGWKWGWGYIVLLLLRFLVWGLYDDYEDMLLCGSVGCRKGLLEGGLYEWLCTSVLCGSILHGSLGKSLR